MKQPERGTKDSVNRRSFLKKGAMAAGAATAGAMLLSQSLPTFAQDSGEDGRPLTRGDIAILRFVAAAELLETDLWQQYAELGGVDNSSQNTYQQAFEFLDGDGPQYISSNTLDELSHAEFLNAYLESKGVAPVNLDAFRTLPSSKATGAQQIGRLTNLMHLNVDTSWYTRYRSAKNPDFGATFPQAITITNRTAIPRNNNDFSDPNHIQAIADTAAFHFASIEQGGSSLYSTLGQKAHSVEVLRILFSIGGDEVAHFLEWVDFAGNSVQGPPYSFDNAQSPVSDNGLTFPNFNEPPFGTPEFQTNLIFPVPTEFISPKLPKCAVIRPTSDAFGGAVAAATGLTKSGLFTVQSARFFTVLFEMAEEADQARREI